MFDQGAVEGAPQYPVDVPQVHLHEYRQSRVSELVEGSLEHCTEDLLVGVLNQ